MRVAYADPPYPRQARKHYRKDPSGIKAQEVDHAALIAELERDYDGWALSTSLAALYDIETMLKAQDIEYRVGYWLKTFCAWKKVNPPWCLEPVILRQPRKSNWPTVRDWVMCPITTRRGTHGAKPEAFCFWLFEAMNLVRDDVLIDKFPGSRAVTDAWEKWVVTAPVTRMRASKRKAPKQARQAEMWEGVPA